jgi:hypothetical protein
MGSENKYNQPILTHTAILEHVYVGLKVDENTVMRVLKESDQQLPGKKLFLLSNTVYLCRNI